MEIAVRAFILPKFAEEEESGYRSSTTSPDYARVLVLDTETTTDRLQNLKFGHCKIFQHGNLQYQCIFYNPDFVNKHERQVLADYCKEEGIRLYKVRNFVDDVFLPEVFDLGTLCVGFNLPFDSSRLAISFGYARGNMRGGFSFSLSKNKKYPRLLIRRLDSTKSFIRFGNAIDSSKRKLGFKGYFLDLRTLAFALTGEKHTLESLCNSLDVPIKKIRISQHGRITREYIDYNVRDVDVTWALFKRLKDEYDIFGLNELPMTRVFSSASIGKACLRAMGIKSFTEKNKTIPREILGNIMAAYFGGRSEVKIRKRPIKITLLDFTSMYPTMCILMKLWDFLVCDHYEWEECTEEIQKFIDTITLDDLQKRETWEKMSVIASIAPSNDILPIRAHYGDKNVWNIGVNVVSSSATLFYALPDIIADKLLTGKFPEIVRAIRFKPVGKQNGLKPIAILGRRIDPATKNFFKIIIEHRKEVQEEQRRCTEALKAQLESKQRGLKTIANATSYGIFMEINTANEPLDVIVYGLSTFDCRASKREEFGDFYNPLIATLITSGARLVLAIVEAILAKHGAVHAFCDTDSMAIPPKFKDEIQRFFDQLNPYDVPVKMFKVVDGDNGEPLENVWCYCLSSKRYVVYRKDRESIVILKASSHGLKHLMSPFANDGMESKWHEQVWCDILNYHYGTMTYDDINGKYENAFAVSELDISTPTIMNRFSLLNKGRSYEHQIKPFNFCLVGIGGWMDPDTGQIVKPLAPYRKDARQAAYDDFVDYNTGKQLRGCQYWKKFADALWDYIRHPESKFDGNAGILQRKNVDVSSVVHIGKESNNLDESEILGTDKDSYVVYASTSQLLLENKEKILATTPSQVRRFGFNERSWLYMQERLKNGNIPKVRIKTIKQLKTFIRSF